MTVHVGQVTSEVTALPSATTGEQPSTQDTWEQRAVLDALLARIDRDRARTATGYGDD
jgi:hypothetical protein